MGKIQKIMLLSFGLLFSTALLVACGGGAPEEGAVGVKAPDFTLPASDGTTVSLDDYVGQKPVLLYFHMAVG